MQLRTQRSVLPLMLALLALLTLIVAACGGSEDPAEGEDRPPVENAANPTADREPTMSPADAADPSDDMIFALAISGDAGGDIDSADATYEHRFEEAESAGMIPPGQQNAPGSSAMRDAPQVVAEGQYTLTFTSDDATFTLLLLGIDRPGEYSAVLPPTTGEILPYALVASLTVDDRTYNLLTGGRLVFTSFSEGTISGNMTLELSDNDGEGAVTVNGAFSNLPLDTDAASPAGTDADEDVDPAEESGASGG